MENIENAKVDNFLLQVKKGNISVEDKNILYNLVMNLKQKTINQKNRFVLYYNIIPNRDIKYSLADIAKFQGCSSNAIRCSLLAIRRALMNHKTEEFTYIVKRNQ